MQIRQLLLTEDQLFARADGEVLRHVEAETVLDCWADSVLAEGTGPSACPEALTELHRVTQDQTLLALMYVEGETTELPAETVAVGIASYQHPSQVHAQWDMVFEHCHDVAVEISGEEFRLSTFDAGGAAGLSFTGAVREHHVIGLDNGHNTITVFTETSRAHAEALMDQQKQKLGIP